MIAINFLAFAFNKIFNGGAGKERRDVLIITRFDLEENFLDDKSAGFKLEDSLLRDSMAISRLCLILAMATVYLVSTGTAVVASGLRFVVDTHWRRGLSYLQIGWRWCKHALSHQKWLHSFLWLRPNPDPEPAIASWKQFYRPMYELHCNLADPVKS